MKTNPADRFYFYVLLFSLLPLQAGSGKCCCSFLRSTPSSTAAYMRDRTFQFTEPAGFCSVCCFPAWKKTVSCIFAVPVRLHSSGISDQLFSWSGDGESDGGITADISWISMGGFVCWGLWFSDWEERRLCVCFCLFMKNVIKKYRRNGGFASAWFFCWCLRRMGPTAPWGQTWGKGLPCEMDIAAKAPAPRRCRVRFPVEWI